jgi:hypothetical protein
LQAVNIMPTMASNVKMFNTLFFIFIWC